ncbi:putative natural product biosynthesis protein [Pseudomonas sp.]|uniref:putative natural product biosynthesis protein n=1 Tax=Pseudomonas sp. TaxID=306 RepID=UPI003BB60806
MSTHYINAQGVDRSKLDALSLHRFLAGYPLTTKTFTQIDSNLRVYWHTLFDLCPGLLKLDGPDGMNMFRGFIKTACAQNLPLNWTLHASFYSWLLSSEFASKVNEEHLEAIMVAAVSLWCSNDTSGKVGIALAHQHSSVVVVGWKTKGHKTASSLEVLEPEGFIPPKKDFGYLTLAQYQCDSPSGFKPLPKR